MSQSSFLQFEEHGDVLVLRILGRSLLDPMSVQEMSDELMEVVVGRKPRKLLVSFSEVGRCSTDVINALLLAKKRLLSQGGELRLCEMSERIRCAYRILSLDGTVFRIYESLDEGLDEFALDSMA
jgi:anti-anti-sigma regulatory factor